jgi:hypothetical protein
MPAAWLAAQSAPRDPQGSGLGSDVVPGSAVQETVALLETATRIQTEPLAYFALAQAEIKAGRYRAGNSTR